MRITEIATRDISRWVSGDIRFTPKEKETPHQAGATKRAREIIVDKDKSSPIALPRRKDRSRRHPGHPASRGRYMCPAAKVRSEHPKRLPL